uniref:Uncharacterized protein n=1 Tax=Caenorhabditis japonica TaxID=281687 RepID=A0A8R1EFV4_CAEJA
MKTEKIQGLLKYIDDRLQTLENEKEDLKEYQKLDKTKRSIEYTMYDNTNKEAIKEKTKLDEQKAELIQKDNNVKTQLHDLSTEILKLDQEKKKLDANIKSLKDDKETLQSEENTMVEEKIKLKLDIDSLNEESNRYSFCFYLGLVSFCLTDRTQTRRQRFQCFLFDHDFYL